METDIRLVSVRATEIEALRVYIEALYQHDEDFDSMINIDSGVRSLLKNEVLASPFFIMRGENRIGYVILTRYHSVEKGGLTIYVDELYVEEDKRRRGVGKVIFAKILELARSWGAKTIWAQTEPHNLPAQAFFTSQGLRVSPYINFEMPL